MFSYVFWKLPPSITEIPRFLAFSGGLLTQQRFCFDRVAMCVVKSRVIFMDTNSNRSRWMSDSSCLVDPFQIATAWVFHPQSWIHSSWTRLAHLFIKKIQKKTKICCTQTRLNCVVFSWGPLHGLPCSMKLDEERSALQTASEIA